MPSTEIVIASARRTPLGAFQGALSALSAPQLGAAALKGALDAAGIEPAAIDEVILGCVLAAGLGQAPARQAAIAAGIPFATPATTINKMCGSGLKAVMMAADQIRAGGAEIVLAGGFESMTRAPYLLPKARAGLPAWATARSSITCSSTVCKALSTASSWAASPTPPPRITASRASSRMPSPPNRSAAPCALEPRHSRPRSFP